MSRSRRNFSAEFKTNLVLQLLKGEKELNVLAVENDIQPNLLRNWKKEFLENAAMIFDRHRPDITEKAQRRKIEELETKLKEKDEVIAEIAEENMMIKKTFGGRS